MDCFNQDNRYSVTAHAANTGCPTLFVFGSEECAVGGAQELPACGAARRGLGAAGYSHVEVKEIDGANHGYEGREGELFRDDVFLAKRALETICIWRRFSTIT